MAAAGGTGPAAGRRGRLARPLPVGRLMRPAAAEWAYIWLGAMTGRAAGGMIMERVANRHR